MEVLNLSEKYGIVERKIFMLGEYWNRKHPIIPVHYIILDRYSGEDDYAVTFTADLDSENTGESVRGTWEDVKEVLLDAEAIRLPLADASKNNFPYVDLEHEIRGKLEPIKWHEIDALLLQKNVADCEEAHAARNHDQTCTTEIIEAALVKLREAGSRAELIQKDFVASENIFLAIKFLNIAINQIKKEEVKK